jgi:hypothetical protein
MKKIIQVKKFNSLRLVDYNKSVSEYISGLRDHLPLKTMYLFYTVDRKGYPVSERKNGYIICDGDSFKLITKKQLNSIA